MCFLFLCGHSDILSGKLACGNCIGINDPTKCGDVTICEAGEDCTGNTLARNGIQCCDSNLCNTNLASPPAEAPYFLPSVKHIHLTDYPGTTAALKCNPHGFPTPDVVWLLPPGVQGEMVNGTLLLRNITANNTGIYTCTASNSAGEANFTLVMDVKEHDPVVATMKFPETDVTSANGVLLIQCEVDGDPKPDVTWSRVGASLSANARIQGNDLLIFPPSDLDVGLYVCNATNSNRETDTAYFARK
ncbi:hypothetical protein BaRGS_00032599 [Batillaria attramentaria]|uniref:Ig-like domain-containing protein n=1 Tax=Batillaria attramentaria TaxID=370345 RepID=A0ABD0JN74_9CAEN